MEEPKPKIQLIKKSRFKVRRSKRGSGTNKKKALKQAANIEDDDPFVPCDSQKWTLRMALEHIGKFHSKLAKRYLEFKLPLHFCNFHSFSNTVIVILFRFYDKLNTDVQNNLRIFYFALEKKNPPRFRNITDSLHKKNIFNRYPWLTSDEKLREPVDITIYKRKKFVDDGEPKPFSEACKQYEIEKRRFQTDESNNEETEPNIFDTMTKNIHLTNVNYPNTSQDNLTNDHFNNIEPQVPLSEDNNIIDKYVPDQHLLLSQEYENMISAISCNYQFNSVVDESSKLNETQIFKENSKCDAAQSSISSKRKAMKRSRWSSPSTETNTTKGLNNLEAHTLINKHNRWSSPSKETNITDVLNNLETHSVINKCNRWSSPSTETNTTDVLTNLETHTVIKKLSPMMHFENRKIKLITKVPLSLGDLIVLVSFYYKLEYIEQQLLIEKMKTLESTKPNQASYLRQYIRIIRPLINEDNIDFKPLPEELIVSEINMNLHNVICIDDILEKDFCVPEDYIQEKRMKVEFVSHDCLNDANNDFDFGSEFL